MLEEERRKVSAEIRKKDAARRGIDHDFREKEHDPYIHGGIAGAGVVRAMEIQQKIMKFAIE